MGLDIPVLLFCLAFVHIASAAFNSQICSSAPYTSVTACAGEPLAEYFCSEDIFVPKVTKTKSIHVSKTSTTYIKVTKTISSVLTTESYVHRRPDVWNTAFVTAPANADAVPEQPGCSFQAFTRAHVDAGPSSIQERGILATGCLCAVGESTTTSTTYISPIATSTKTTTYYTSTTHTGTSIVTGPGQTYTNYLTRLSNLLTQTTPCPEPTTSSFVGNDGGTHTFALYKGVFATYGPSANGPVAFEIDPYTDSQLSCVELCFLGNIDIVCDNVMWNSQGLPGCITQTDMNRGTDYVCYPNSNYNSSILLGTTGGD